MYGKLQWGILYELDRYIAGEILDEDKCRLIELLHRKSEHKRKEIVKYM